MNIISILDNINSENKSLISEHGLSIYIRGTYNNLLFDFGQGENTFKNFKNLNLDPNDIDKFVISHNHYDHANGLLYFTEYISGKDLIVGQDFFRRKYAKEGETYTYLASNFTRAYLEMENIRPILVDECYKIDEELYIMGGFVDKSKKNRLNSRFYIYEDGELFLDNFSDEIALVIKSEKGLSVVLGCSHPGVILILKSIEKRFNLPIINVFGGTHLVESSEEEIALVAHELKKMKIKNIYFSHCSGTRALDVFANIEGINSFPLYTGGEIIL